MASKSDLIASIKAISIDKAASANERAIAKKLLVNMKNVELSSSIVSEDVILDYDMSNDLRLELAMIAPSYGCVIVYDEGHTYARGIGHQASAFSALIANAFELCKNVDDVDVAISILRLAIPKNGELTASIPDVSDCSKAYKRSKSIGKRKTNKAKKIIG